MQYIVDASIILREKCLYSEFFRFAFSRIWTEHGEKLHICLYSVRIQENTDRKISEYEHFSRNVNKARYVTNSSYLAQILTPVSD